MFSICIPNFNYERYLGETIRSVLTQDVPLEVVVSDNASTDGSANLVRSLGDERVRLHVNRCNVGFAGNLDRAARMATGNVMMVLSSDDLVLPGALTTYQRVLKELGDDTSLAIVSARWKIIDAGGVITGETGPDPELWPSSSIDRSLSQRANVVVYRRNPLTLLVDSLRRMRNPFNFAATVYGRKLYEAIEGYGGGRLINPDKWFNWRALGVANTACFIDEPLVAYRWHEANQSAQQDRSSSLKYLVDEYACTLEIEEKLLTRLGLTRKEVVEAFVEYDVARHGLATLARGDSVRAQRVLRFGQAVYPDIVGRSGSARALSLLLSMGGVGRHVARIAYERQRSRGSRSAQRP
ncbi:MAG: glycosyltransferase family 2 protein [Acidobacteria bacterium]|nr:glycosyltransferase family 2 protein [Acidobacteriota bacterium]